VYGIINGVGFLPVALGLLQFGLHLSWILTLLGVVSFAGIAHEINHKVL
jgi:hypothetical protein